ncbi:PAS domain-containing sensor histidine kinase [Magnetospirillum sulfuroxidans]|uniref:histidine kinase n=1 Tax=Magnetospirillum sulfuroxidans TaxID=611300 RepID=A0ABS5I8G8_9PROT|nr:ATP-binding protein [Magnetospirillum sulfuroxidans]MBR9970452.1 PAS domain-containing sensor histidine kinase [Magnetospirillum sulfuroxidans]
MTSRLMAGGSLVAILLWFALDMFHSARIDAIVHANIGQQLDVQAEAGQARFQETLRTHFALTTFLSTSRPISELAAIALAQPASLEIPKPVRLGSLAILENPLGHSDISFMVMIDGNNRIRMLLTDNDGAPPIGLSRFLPSLPANSAYRAIVQKLGGEVYVISVHAIADTAARLVVFTRWDAGLIARTHGFVAGSDHVVVIADMVHDRVAASSDPQQVPPGTSLVDLDPDWLSASLEFPTHGGVDFLPAFVSLVSRSYVNSLAQPLLRQEREQRTVLAVTLIVLFMLVMVVLTIRLRQIIHQVAEVTASVTGSREPLFQRGDEMAALVRQVRILATEVRRSRVALGQEVAEKLRLNDEKMHVREENARLRLLQSVTERLRVGVVRMTANGPVAENKAMVEISQTCGGLSAFVETKKSHGTQELLVREPHGGERIFEILAADDIDDGLILVTDVTEQRRAEQMIHSLALFPAQNPYPVLRISSDGVILHANPASDPLLGEWGTGMGRAVPDEWLGIITEVLTTGRTIQAELPVAGRFLSLTLVPVSADSYVNIYAADVSDRVAVERQLALANEGLERRVIERTRDLLLAKEQAELASRTKTEFLATISHELRTPLNAIIGFSEVMAGAMFGPLGNGRYQGYAIDIVNSGRHLLAVINDILDVSKVEAGQMSLDIGPVDVPAMIDSAVRLVETRAQSGKLRLRSEIEPDLPVFHGDRRRCLQILVNLLSNAVKFTPEGGSVTVSAAHENTGICLRVTDTGIGMSESEIQLALEPFRQVDGSLSRQYEGTGLGLPLAKSMTELHGGTLIVSSRKGEGTEVMVWLPLEPLAADDNWQI